MAEVIWTSPAFRFLEALPQETAFAIFRQVDYLRGFREMGPRMDRPRERYRQLIRDKRFRVIYRYDAATNEVIVVHLQSRHQKLPGRRKLDRVYREHRELPLE